MMMYILTILFNSLFDNLCNDVMMYILTIFFSSLFDKLSYDVYIDYIF